MSVLESDDEDTVSILNSLNALHTQATSTSLVRRRSSVRSRVSFSGLQKHAEELLITDYASDPAQRWLVDFEELMILGVGSYGCVRLVKDKHTGRYYAKKTVRKARIAVDRVQLKNHRNERDILSSISHPGIVKLFYAFHDDEDIHLILEFIPGGELFLHLEDHGRFNEYDAAQYMAEIAQSLRHLHSLGVVYRDLKPENCMLDAQGHIVLTDFGLSSQEEKCHSVLGTPEYCAPEVLKGHEYSYKADWWSFGVMLYDLMVGQVPFRGNNRASILRILRKRGVVVPQWLSQDAGDLLKRLLQRNPDKRFDVDADFDKFMNHRFFRRINWERLRQMDPPVVPDICPPEEIREDEEQINYALSTRTHAAGFVDQKLFEGFTFVADKDVLDSYKGYVQT